MKKLFVLVAVTLSLGAAAQENQMLRTSMRQEKQMKNEIMMNDGKITVVKRGKTKVITKDIIMPNGDVVSPDGMVKMKNGRSVLLKNGEILGMTANVMKMEK